MKGLMRALAARCPLCGSKGIWKSFGQTKDRCPRCGHLYAHEEGYWVGAMAINIGLAMVLFFAVFAIGIATSWPNVAWGGVAVATIAAMALAPILLYRQSKTIWVWVDTRLHPYEGEKRGA